MLVERAQSHTPPLCSYVALRTLDENFPDGVDVLFYYVGAIGAHCVLAHAVLLVKVWCSTRCALHNAGRHHA